MIQNIIRSLLRQTPYFLQNKEEPAFWQTPKL